jgi:hypothetical protein
MPAEKRSFTIRVDIELYLKLGQIAQSEGLDINAVVNRLIKLGLGERESMLALLNRIIQSDDAKEILSAAA